VQAVRREGQPALEAVRRAWLSVRVTSSRSGHIRPDRSTGLRARVAAATRIAATSTGVRIVVDGRKIDPVYGNSLAWYLNDSGRRPWRHPVFGRRDRSQDWQQQRGQKTFFTTLNAHAPQFRSAIERAMEDVARRF
jgi:hypothetical protein